MTGLQAIQPVIISFIQSSFCCPVGQSSRKKTCDQLGEPADYYQVHRKSLAEHPADHPGPLTCAKKCLSDRDREENKTKHRYY